MRLVVLALLAANLAFFAWTQGWLDAVLGVRANAGREPERLARQVRPELIRVLVPGEVAAPASGAASSPSAAPAKLACLQAGPFGSGDIGAAEAALQAAAPGLAPGRYASLRIEQPGVWVVHVGRFAAPDELREKQAELDRLHLPYESLSEPAELAPGLALGRYDSKAAADAALARLGQRGVRSAQVAALTPPNVAHVLRVERADAGLERRLLGLADAPFATRRFEPCSGIIAAVSASAPAAGPAAR